MEPMGIQKKGREIDSIIDYKLGYNYRCPYVASRCAVYVMGSNDNSSFSKTSSTYRSRHVVAEDFTDIQLDYGNFYGSSDSPIQNDIYVSASIEKKNQLGETLFYPLQFKGNRTGVISPGGYITSDELGLEFTKGEVFYVRTYVYVQEADHKWPAGLALFPTVDGESGVLGDKTSMEDFPWNWQSVTLWSANANIKTGDWRRASSDWKYLYRAETTGTTGTTAPTSTTDGEIVTDGSVTWKVYQSPATGCYGYTPMGISGRTKKIVPTIAMIGDSIISGAGDVNPRKTSVGGDNYGFFVRAINDQIGLAMLNHSGERTEHFIGDNRIRRILRTNSVTHAVVEHGINDVNYQKPRTFEQIKTNLLNIYTALAQRGIKVYATTLTPVTTSTDNWATEQNQSVKSNEAARVAVNEWIRTTPYPLSGYFETADTVETHRNSGIWKKGTVNVADGLGIHPSPQGHLNMASAIDVSVFKI
jgi:lysophospholipase L1-like esterase